MKTSIVEDEKKGESLDSESSRSFDAALAAVFRHALRISLFRPGRLLFLARQAFWQRRAAAVRRRWLNEGLAVPPLLIMSVTRRCNLSCAGCYSAVRHAGSEAELTPSEVMRIISEASDMGISIVMIAGGEPLLRPEILSITARFKRIIFPFFTNGQKLTPELAAEFSAQPNVIPILSLEGDEAATDLRRGNGVFRELQRALDLLKDRRILFGTSITTTSENFEFVTSDSFVHRLMEAGCRIVFNIEYVPAVEGTSGLVLTRMQRSELPRRLQNLEKRFPAIFIAFPGDETPYGGCLAAGRGFLHINPVGRLEPCPFAPYSDVSLRDHSLRWALQSDFLREVRLRHGILSEGDGGCALWANRRVLDHMLNQSFIPPQSPLP